MQNKHRKKIHFKVDQLPGRGRGGPPVGPKDQLFPFFLFEGFPYFKALKWRHALPHKVHVNLSYDSSTCTRKWKHLFTCNPLDILGESSSFLQKCIRSYNGCICKNTFVIPQPSHKNAFVVTLDAFVRKHFCESSSCPQKCISKYIGCICKKNNLPMSMVPS